METHRVLTGARRFLLSAAVATAVWAGFLAQSAAGHRGGSWMFPADVQHRVEARGYTLAICNGRGPYRAPSPPIPDRRYLKFRHFECFVNDRGGLVLCVHTRAAKRISFVVRPVGHRCRF